jgi:hypothetical protein
VFHILRTTFYTFHTPFIDFGPMLHYEQLAVELAVEESEVLSPPYEGRFILFR